LDEKEKESIRVLSDGDMSYFSNELHIVVKQLIVSISQELDGAMSNSIIKSILDIKHGNV